MRSLLSFCVFSLLVGTGTIVSADEIAPAPAFPKIGLLPKTEIGVYRLLKKHPEADGRGTVVAVFDTGVDPGANGLQTTTDGKPKIIDIVDATGSGDVLMSAPQKPKENTLTGLTGRTLKLNPKWKNPRGEYRLGIKAAYDLFPDALISRMKSDRKKTFKRSQRLIESRLRQQIVRYDALKTSSAKIKNARKELQAQLTQLLASANFADPGPVYDCVVFHDGNNYRAAVDTDEDGSFADEIALTNYRDERQFATFGQGSLLNFSVNIYENGQRLSLVANSGAHSTHVAGIIAAHYPRQPELNGVAPGAQIVSVKIGDSRLGSMETATGIVRGLRAVIDNRCDLINMSYGEPSHVSNHGRLISLLTEVVRKHGVIFVGSAGNAGPALSTVGAPGGDSSDLIGVGAYVSSEMMAVEYTLREKLPGLPYTWTSRGPTSDGDMGVDIFAPGGAIAPVPNWTLQKSMRMNGTSMASPNCCGGIALLLSAMKAAKVRYTPYSVRRAIANSAKWIKTADVFAQGPGLLQVDSALKYLLKNQRAIGEQLRFNVRVSRRGGTRGIYLRKSHEISKPSVNSVSVKPIFPERTNGRTKTAFEMRIALVATEPWVRVGSHFLLTNGGSQFTVSVDPTKLKSGAHFAEVHGIDASHPERGPIFRVPVTVISPTPLSEKTPFEHRTTLEFKTAEIHRQFFVVPPGAEWADLTLRARSSDSQPRRFILHTLETHAGQSIDKTAERSFISLNHGHLHSKSFAVRGGHVVEVCLASYWSSLGASTVEFELNFRGLTPSQRTVSLEPGVATGRVEVTALTDNETIAPKATLNTRRTFIRPKSAVVRALDFRRDRLPNGQPIYELQMTYEFEQKSSGTVTPRFAELDGMLYDSPFGTHLWMLFDSVKRRVVTDDIWPSAVSLRKVRYTLILQLRHSDVTKLERQKKMLLTLDRSLAKPITLSIYGSRIAAADRSPKFASRTLQRNERAAVIVAAPSVSSLPGSVMDGDVLLGTISYGKSVTGQPGAGKRPKGYSLQFSVAGTGRNQNASTAKKKSNSSLSGSTIAAKIRSLKFQKLEKIAATGQASKAFEQLASELSKVEKDKFRVLRARLTLLDHEKYRKQHLAEVVKAADAVLAAIDSQKISSNFGSRLTPGDSKAASLRKAMEKQRDILADTLYRKGRALGYMELPEVLEKTPIKDKKAHDKVFEANFIELQKWVDTTDKKYVLLQVRRERRKNRLGSALGLLRKYDSPSSTNYWYHKKQCDMFEKLGWRHLAEYAKRSLIIRFPKAYPPF